MNTLENASRWRSVANSLGITLLRPADLFAIRGIPKCIRSDNGPEFISRRVRDFLAAIDVATCFIEPGSPWQNGFVESFNARFRDECLNCEEFTSVQEARVVIEHWRQNYNHRRPHSSLDGLTPAAFGSCNPALVITAVPWGVGVVLQNSFQEGTLHFVISNIQLFVIIRPK